MPRLPSLSALRAFEIAARTKNFSEAGKEINVTHAAISQHVRKLEEHLGIPLFKRKGRTLHLTSAGKRLGEQLSMSFSEIDDVLTELDKAKSLQPLKLTMTPSFASEWLLPRIFDFREKYPNIKLVINPSFALSDLASEGIDLGIRFGTGTWDGLKSEMLIASSFVVVAGKKLLKDKVVNEADDLKDLPWLQELGTNEVEAWLLKQGIKFHNKTDIIYLPGHMILNAARDGCGVACTAYILVKDDVKNGNLQMLFDEGNPENNIGYYLITTRNLKSRNAEIFINWIKTAVFKEDNSRRGRTE